MVLNEKTINNKLFELYYFIYEKKKRMQKIFGNLYKELLVYNSYSKIIIPKNSTNLLLLFLAINKNIFLSLIAIQFDRKIAFILSKCNHSITNNKLIL